MESLLAAQCRIAHKCLAPAQYNLAGYVNAVHLKYRLGDVQPDCRNLSHGSPPRFAAGHPAAVGGEPSTALRADLLCRRDGGSHRIATAEPLAELVEIQIQHWSDV